jgi:hypothetical protein
MQSPELGVCAFGLSFQRMLLITQPPARRIESSVKATLPQLFSKTWVRTRSQPVRIALEQYRSDLMECPSSPKCEAIERPNTLYTAKQSNSALRFF